MIVIDRIEGKFAVCESDGRITDIPIKLIRGKIRDGVVLVERGGVYAVDEQATEKRTAEMKDASKDVFES